MGADRLQNAVVGIADWGSAKACIAEAITFPGGVDILLNAAHIRRSSHAQTTTLESFEQAIRINLIGTFLLIRETFPSLLADNDVAVVNFSSTSASFVHPYVAAYAASNEGVQSMTHALASEYAPKGIRFTAVQRGSIPFGITSGESESRKSVGPGLPADIDITLLGKLQPILGGGFASPAVAASVMAMLLNDDGKFITGTEDRSDGAPTAKMSIHIACCMTKPPDSSAALYTA